MGAPAMAGAPVAAVATGGELLLVWRAEVLSKPGPIGLSHRKASTRGLWRSLLMRWVEIKARHHQVPNCRV